MKLLHSWLEELAPTGLTAAALADRFAAAGIEVNSVTRPCAGISGVVIARVTACLPHPNADRLRLCQADTGGGRTVQVVTAATNVQAGHTVPLALAGAVLAGGLEIKKSKLRGEVSEGMFCSTAELGLTPTADGIWLLPDTLTPGDDALAALGLQDEWLIDYEVPANRGDLYGVLGMAREAAAACGTAVRLPALDYPEGTEAAAGLLRVRIDAPDLCARYAATVVRGCRATAPAPFALQRRLLLAGQRPLGLAVDVTNYVLLEWGHPLHAFDRACLRGGEIIVRRAAAGEKAVLLDGQERELNAQLLVIADRDRAVALAGVMGGAESGVTEQTADLVIESAWFAPAAVRAAARAAKLATGAAQVFERGADRLGLLAALRRATALLVQHGGGAAAAGIIDVLPEPLARTAVRLRPARVNRVLGTDLPAGTAERILRALGCDLEPAGTDTLQVTVPSWRNDLTREEDLIEEVARHYGYDRIPARVPALSVAQIPPPDAAAQQARAAEDLLVARGWQQVITYAFHHADATLTGDTPPLALRNPLSPEMAVLRTLLLPGLLQALQGNAGYRSDSALRLCERGRVFLPYDTECLPREEEHLGLAAWGTREEWRGGLATDVFALKGDLEALLAQAGYTATFAPASRPWLEPGTGGELAVGSTVIGWCGVVAAALADRHHLRGAVVAAELNLSGLPAAARAAAGHISRQPAVDRDLAIIVPEAVTAAELRAVIEAEGGEWLERLTLFDLYRGAPLAAGEKSVGYRLLFRAAESTLTDAQVARVLEGIVARLQERCGARIRS